MKWIKTHLTIVICGAVSIASIALIALGIVMSTVQETMARDASIIQSLQSARPVNERVIQDELKIFEANEKQIKSRNEELAKGGGYQPLLQDVFPELKPANRGAQFRFKPLLLEAQQRMVAELHAKQAPTPREVAIEAELMKNQKARVERAESLGASAVPVPGTPAGSFGAVSGGTFASSSDAARRATMTPEELAEQYADVRLAIRRAREIYCYVGPNEDTFGSWSAVTASANPSVDDMWYAQMGLWIQQDVVKALASLNNRIADALKARQQDPWVGNLPIKRLERITIYGYSVGNQGDALRPATPKPDGAPPSFAQQSCTDTVDVIDFNVKLVVEARMLPSVIDELCKAGFFTPILVNYTLEPANLSWAGYIYGSAPSLDVSIDIQGSFLRAKYGEWMPKSVIEGIRNGTAQFQQSFQSGDAGRAPSRSFAPGPGFGRRDHDMER